MIELSLGALIDNFPANRAAMDLHAARFNALFRTRWDRVVEFLKLHYLLSRRDEPYWRAQRDPATVPPRLAELRRAVARPAAVELTICRWSTRYSLRRATNMSGTGWAGAVPSHLPPPTPAMRAQLEQVRQRTRSLLSALPSNRALLGPRVASGKREKVAQP